MLMLQTLAWKIWFEILFIDHRNVFQKLGHNNKFLKQTKEIIVLLPVLFKYDFFYLYSALVIIKLISYFLNRSKELVPLEIWWIFKKKGEIKLLDWVIFGGCTSQDLNIECYRNMFVFAASRPTLLWGGNVLRENGPFYIISQERKKKSYLPGAFVGVLGWVNLESEDYVIIANDSQNRKHLVNLQLEKMLLAKV